MADTVRALDLAGVRRRRGERSEGLDVFRRHALPLLVTLLLNGACHRSRVSLGRDGGSEAVMDAADDVGDASGSIPDAPAGSGGAESPDAEPGLAEVGVDVADDSGPGLLDNLRVAFGSLTPAFSPTLFAYSVQVSDSWALDAFTVTPTADPRLRLAVNETPVASGTASPAISIPANQSTRIDVTVTAPNGTVQHYSVGVTNIPSYVYVKASNTHADDGFGTSVAIADDTLVVGAPNEPSHAVGIDGDQTDTSASKAGAAYVYVRSDGKWAQQAYLKASQTQARAAFGSSVAILGDTLAVGAPYESSGDGLTYGAVYLFTRSGTTWSQQARLTAPPVARGTFASVSFGTSVSLSGDTLAVGAPDPVGLGLDSAFVFKRVGGIWSQEAELDATTYVRTGLSAISRNLSQCRFGETVALSGDTLALSMLADQNGSSGIDGNENDDSVPWAGAVFVFVRSGTTWWKDAYLKASNPRAYAFFGWNIALSGKMLAVGATGDKSGATGINADQTDASVYASGAVYVFRRDDGGVWSQEAYVKSSNAGRQGQLGYSVAFSGENVLAAGAINDISSIVQTGADIQFPGAVYIFVRGPNAAWSERALVWPPNPNPFGFFGYSVAWSGSVLAVSAPGESSDSTGINGKQTGTDAPKAGAAYVMQ